MVLILRHLLSGGKWSPHRTRITWMYWKYMQLNWNISVCTDVRLCVHMHVGVCMCVAVETGHSVQALESVRLLGVSLCHSRSPSL